MKLSHATALAAFFATSVSAFSPTSFSRYVNTWGSGPERTIMAPSYPFRPSYLPLPLLIGRTLTDSSRL